MDKMVFVILHYMTIDDTERCVKSILANAPNCDIIIVDNGSPNKSGDELKKEYLDYKQIHFIRNKRNLGFAKGNNVGFDYAKKTLKAKFIVLCNNDTVLLDKDFQSNIKEAYEKTGFAVLGPKENLPDNKVYPLIKTKPTIHNIKFKIRRLRYKIFFPRLSNQVFKVIDSGKALIKNRNKTTTVNNQKEISDIVLHGAFLVFSEKYITMFDGLDPRTFMYEEENMLYLRLKKKRLVSLYYPKIEIMHFHKSSTRAKYKNKKELIRNTAREELKSAKILLADLEKKDFKYDFVTLFPRIENAHVKKDVGMIPYTLSKYYGLKTGLVIYKDREYPNLKKANDFTPIFFPKNSRYNSILNIKGFLNKHSHEIKVLCLYHIHRKETLYAINKFLKKNKNGVVYVHMDLDPKNINKGDILILSGTGFKKAIKRFIYKKIIFKEKNISRIYFGSQLKSNIPFLSESFPFKNVLYVPNGYEEQPGKEKSEAKENTILFVGRASSSQKRVDLLLNAFSSVEKQIPDWKLQIIGEMDVGFMKEFKEKYTGLNNKIELINRIEDKSKLEKYYKKARIFCLPSDYESFGLVTVEGLANGCYIIGSDIPATREIIGDSCGVLFKKGNETDLAKKILSTCRNEEILNKAQLINPKHAKKNYSYSCCLKGLYDIIEGPHEQN